MSESQVNQTSNNQNSSVTRETSSGGNPPTSPAAPIQKQPTIMPGAGVTVTEDPVQFDSAHIGTRTVKRQDLFAAQNQAASEKKAKNAKTRKKVFIVLGVILGVALVGLGVWLAVMLTSPKNDSEPDDSSRVEATITDGSDEGISKMLALAQAKYDSNKRIVEVDQLFADEAAVTNPDYLNQLHLAQILFYTGNGFYQQSADLSDKIDTDKLPLSQKGTFYDAMYSTYNGLKDSVKAGEYFALSYEVQVEIQGYDEGEDGRDGI